MALDPLASAADLAARGITVATSEQIQAGVFLRVASSVIRDAAGCPISRLTSTIRVPGTREQRLRIPAGPVTAVSAVAIDGTAVTDWTLLPGDVLWRRLGWQQLWCDPSVVTATVTHGLGVVPEDIVDLTCRLVAAALVALRSDSDGSGLAASPGVVQERIDDYAVTFDSATQTTEMELSDRLRELIATRFGAGIGLVGL